MGSRRIGPLLRMIGVADMDRLCSVSEVANSGGQKLIIFTE
jgi:high-affinity K+ transport system ATPase subunit B